MVSGGGDSWGYYAYLPSFFINKDLKDLRITCATRKKYNEHSEECKNADGYSITKYTSGVAFFHLPAFLISDLCAQFTDYDKDGFSKPYIFGLYLSTLFYVLWGLYLLGIVLAKQFSIRITMLTLAILALCTNLYYFSVYNNVMSHPISFFLFAALIYNTDIFYKELDRKRLFILGLILGVITLIRPTNSIAILIPLLWGISSIKDRTSLIREHSGKLPYAILGFFLALLPQLLYWKYATGQFIYYSYQGEGFDFKNSMIGRGLFSFRNGWLIYTPVMFLVFPGLFFLFKKRSKAFWPVLILLPLHVYIIYSWWNWYYINGLGSRPMVDIYPILAFALAASLTFLFSNKILAILFSGILLFLTSLNVFQVYQHSKGVLWTEDANASFYKQVFGQTKWSQAIAVVYDLNRFQPSNYESKRQLYRDDFTAYKQFEVPQTPRDGRPSVLLSHESVASLDSFVVSAEELNLGKEDLLTLKVWMRVEDQITRFYDFSSIFIEYYRDGKNYKRNYLRLHNKPCPESRCSLWYGEVHVWDELIAHIKPQEFLEAGDTMKFKFYMPDNSTPLFLSNFEIHVSSVK